MRLRRRCITIINNEIDYDKLAEAVAKAVKTEPKTQEVKTEISFLKKICFIIRNKKDTDRNLTIGIFSGLLTVLFNSLAIIVALVGVLFLIGMFVTAANTSWTADKVAANIASIALSVILIFFSFLFAVFLRGSANEINKEKDSNFILSVFSGVVSFSALIVALIALLEGVA